MSRRTQAEKLAAARMIFRGNAPAGMAALLAECRRRAAQQNSVTQIAFRFGPLHFIQANCM